jgi:hypothetical protein
MKSLSLKRMCLAGIGVAFFLAGCELITDFDRTKIPGGGFDGSVDQGTIDVTPQPDAAPDAKADAAPDAPSDGGAADGDATTTTDASDAATDADDGSTDAAGD